MHPCDDIQYRGKQSIISPVFSSAFTCSQNMRTPRRMILFEFSLSVRFVQTCLITVVGTVLRQNKIKQFIDYVNS